MGIFISVQTNISNVRKADISIPVFHMISKRQSTEVLFCNILYILLAQKHGQGEEV